MGRRWTVGELAHATGMTVRTLHHYDELGLVSPGERTAAGHLRYTAADVRRLYGVRALRQLGLSLSEIAGALDRTGDDPAGLRHVLTAQVHRLRTQAERITRLQARLGDLVAQRRPDR
ncbi:MerR family transcriptional regulator [Planosporangium sp. 12N6]|uniref:MerR family transcriptional regulator n=1 Tax=Planosporangium spinosum TaxID=3402278 RepID=UPI003CF783FB